MKKLLLVGMILVTMSSCGWQHRTIINGVDLDRVKQGKALHIIGGALAAMAIHEGGHMLAMKITGAKDIEYIPPAEFHYNSSGMTNGEMQWVSRSGFIAENLIGSILTNLEGTKNSGFTIGYAGAAAAQTILYPLPPGETTDIYELQKLGGKAWFEYGGYSLWSLYNLDQALGKEKKEK